MKKFIILALTILSSLSVFAESNRTGIILLNGSNQNVSLEAKDSGGTITVGAETFIISDNYRERIQGYTLVKNGNIKLKDMNITVLLSAVAEDRIKDFVHNKTEVKCSEKSNAVVLIADNLDGSVVGNCVTLNTSHF